jgi:hypothetical protein
VRLRPNRGVPLGLALKRNPTARTLRTGLMKSLAFSHERFLSCDAYGRPRRGRLEEAICGGVKLQTRAWREIPVRAEPHPTLSFAPPAPRPSSWPSAVS